LDYLPEFAQHLYFMFCTMDKTCISLDLLRRACSPKYRWGSNGAISEAKPRDASVPSWLFDMVVSQSGQINELALVEDIYRLEYLFLVRRESVAGDWSFQGQVAKNFGSEQSAILVKMEHYVQEIGKLMLEDEKLHHYAAAAICAAVHALEDDVTSSVRMKGAEAKFDDCFVVLTPTGGMTNNVFRLTLTLTEYFGHIRNACECLPDLMEKLKKGKLMRMLDLSLYSAPVSCWFILSGIHLGGRNPATACATFADLASAIAFGAVALQKSTLRHDLHGEDTLLFWALASMITRVTEWFLWARKCWENGTQIASGPIDDPPGYALISRNNADFNPDFFLIASAIMEYHIAQAQRESPFGELRDLSTAHYVSIYWEVLLGQAKRIFGHECQTPSGEFLPPVLTGCLWLLTELPSSRVKFREELHITMTSGVSEPKGSFGYPRIPLPLDVFFDDFRKTDLCVYVQLGMAIITNHSAKKPLVDFLPFVNTSRLPDCKQLT